MSKRQYVKAVTNGYRLWEAYNGKGARLSARYAADYLVSRGKASATMVIRIWRGYYVMRKT